MKKILQSAQSSFTSLRELYLSKLDKSDLNKTYKNILALFLAEKLSEDLALNFLNLQQAWIRLDTVVKVHKIDPGIEFVFSELLGHFYAAESIFIEVIMESDSGKLNSDKLKISQSIRASQVVLTDLAGLSAKLTLTGASIESIDPVLALNTGCTLREEIATGLGL